jgi:FkbM family methyltransferase
VSESAGADPPQLAELLSGFSGLLAFDVGANTGATAALLAQRFAHVVALEPCVESYEQLSSLDAANVTARQLAVSDRPGVLDLVVQADPIRSGQLTTEGTRDAWGEIMGHRYVPATTVDALTAQHGDPDLLKVDVEGHELRVLQSALRTLHMVRPALFIEVHSARLGQEIRSLLADWYPDLRRVDETRYTPGEWGHENHFWLMT